MSLMTRVDYRLFGKDAPLMELYLILHGFGVGVMIVLVEDAEKISPLLRGTRKFIGHDLLGLLMVASCVVGLTAWIMEWRRVRAALALLASAALAMFSVIMWLSGVPVMAQATLPLCAIFSGLVYVRHMTVLRSVREARAGDHDAVSD